MVFPRFSASARPPSFCLPARPFLGLFPFFLSAGPPSFCPPVRPFLGSCFLLLLGVFRPPVRASAPAVFLGNQGKLGSSGWMATCVPTGVYGNRRCR